MGKLCRQKQLEFNELPTWFGHARRGYTCLRTYLCVYVCTHIGKNSIYEHMCEKETVVVGTEQIRSNSSILCDLMQVHGVTAKTKLALL